MEQLLQNVKKELDILGSKELTAADVDIAGKLVDIVKDYAEIKDYERKEGIEGMRYQNKSYFGNDYPYRERGHNTTPREMGRREEYGHSNWGMWGQTDYDKLSECLDRIADGKDMYRYDKSRYRGDDERVLEGLEKMMYGVCMFVETAMNFAETPEEKEIIRKHIRKLEEV